MKCPLCDKNITISLSSHVHHYHGGYELMRAAGKTGWTCICGKDFGGRYDGDSGCRKLQAHVEKLSEDEITRHKIMELSMRAFA